MKVLKLICVASLLLYGSVTSEVQAGREQTSLEAADNALKAGKFAEAEKLYAKTLSADPKSQQAALGLARVALFANRLADAEKWSKKAIELKPDDKTAKLALAEVYYRRDDFQRAAPLFRAAEREPVARKLESFNTKPYDVRNRELVGHLKFLQTDPLPLVQVLVNGSGPVNFLIDTGGGEVIVDTEFAKEVSVPQFGVETGAYAGQRNAPLNNGRIDSLILGGLEVRNLPVRILDTRRYAAVAHGKRIDGILGTVLLYHFLATIDYQADELVLRPRKKSSLLSFERVAAAEKQIVVPFWMAGDHFILAWGRVNQVAPLLLFVDTGLAGLGFTAPRSTLEAAGIKLPEDQSSEKTAARPSAVRFTVNQLALGEAVEKNIGGLFGVFEGELAGIRIAGLISHQFFRPYALTLDFTGMRLFLKRKN